jgi:hypothetical protein
MHVLSVSRSSRFGHRFYTSTDKCEHQKHIIVVVAVAVVRMTDTCERRLKDHLAN